MLRWLMWLISLVSISTPVDTATCYARVPEISELYLKATCVFPPLRRCLIYDAKNSPIFYGYVKDIYCIRDEL